MKVTSDLDVMVLLGPELSKHLNFDQEGDVVVATPKRRVTSTVFKQIAKKVRELNGKWVRGKGFIIPITR